ncbi:hypothetical protein CAOG_08782 [Capsaspora owczarzaki ATCC 30864]|uniref:Uncharacterized protein n=1 Tax=Capsaspora owczarzaki (strain ATCC 30864) TaxID=595528 RepID=A0A0D2WRB7_CAPO3|nr:hypothetical protein CAOG_08782 [Capsaspora owczarzaki ATCC 30864]KJE93723.1 hypothetical protein CAOG_008782 [Capsaspora owczarzaki ATCC 30864]|eukprot:XP_011270412.1 hypothetical protein CAOG_08782 [Capsaspora owczarzaki ATCC 30864]
MPVYIFVQTDLMFNGVFSAVTQLSQRRQIGHLGYKSVTNACIVNRESIDTFDNAYHWARTTAVILRNFMIEACNLPLFPSNAQTTIPNQRTTRIDAAGEQISITSLVEEAERVRDSYDQLFPHYLLQDSANSANSAPGSFVRRAVIVVRDTTTDTWRLYDLHTTLRWQRMPNPSTEWKTVGTVTCVGGIVTKDANADAWKRLLLLIEDDDDASMKRADAIVEALVADLKKLDVNPNK